MAGGSGRSLEFYILFFRVLLGVLVLVCFATFVVAPCYQLRTLRRVHVLDGLDTDYTSRVPSPPTMNESATYPA